MISILDKSVFWWPSFAAMQRSFLYISMSISFSNYPYSKRSFLAKIVLKLFSILSLWTRKVDLQSFTKEWKNWQKCKLDFHVKNTQYKDLPYCFSTLYSKKQWPMKLSDYYCPNFSLFPFLAKRSLKVRIWSVTTILMIGFESI